MGRSYPARSKDLSPRELDLLRRIAAGQSQAEAAAEMLVSRATAEDHSWEFRRKLGARTVAQAVAIAVRRGIIE